MFWLVEDESQLQLFEKIQHKEAFVEVMKRDGDDF